MIKISNLKYVIAFLIPIFMVVMLAGCLNNDSWFVLSEGRQIVEHGIYYTDELSMHSDFQVTVQNYGFAVIFWLIYSATGIVGLYVGMLAMFGLILWLLYKICMLISNKNVNLSLMLMMVTGVVMSFGFIVTRGQIVSYAILLGVIYALELFIKTDKVKYLAWLPVLSLAAINLRASVWWMIFLVIMAYLVDAIRKPKWHLQGYRWKPIVGATLVSLVVGLINPYGIKMITFVFTSYGVAEISNLVNEMHPFNPMSGVELIFYLAIVSVIISYVFGKGKNVRVRYLLLFFGFLMLGLSSVKVMGELILVMFFPLAFLYKSWKMPRVIEDVKIWWMMVSWMGIATVCLTVGAASGTLYFLEDAPSQAMAEAMDVIDAKVEENSLEKKELKIYVGYNNGGYVEFRGYKAFLDPRAEVFIKKNNGVADLLKEWEEFVEGKERIEEFLEKYNFDYLVVDNVSDWQIYEMENNGYAVLYEDSEEEIKVLERVRDE